MRAVTARRGVNVTAPCENATLGTAPSADSTLRATQDVPLRIWSPEKLSPRLQKILGRLQRSDDVHHVAVMPDVHEGKEVPNGLVLATKNLIYPQAVGGDIGCGIAALRFRCDRDLLRSEQQAAILMSGLYDRVPSLIHRGQAVPLEISADLQGRVLSASGLEKEKSRDARLQLGTLGRGNHFVEFQADDEGTVWLMVHTGSRGIGQKITDFHLRNAESTNSGLKALDVSNDKGRAYLNDMNWALDYAQANRRAIVGAVVEIFRNRFGIQSDDNSYVDCHHNFARFESHFGGQLLVHRKSALSAQANELGLIPGSMGTESYHTVGRGEVTSLTSSAHGAGRALSRSEAFDKIRERDLDRQMGDVWFDRRLTRKLLDEAPGAYKKVGDVMRSQSGLTAIVRKLTPLLVYKCP